MWKGYKRFTHFLLFKRLQLFRHQWSGICAVMHDVCSVIIIPRKIHATENNVVMDRDKRRFSVFTSRVWNERSRLCTRFLWVLLDPSTWNITPSCHVRVVIWNLGGAAQMWCTTIHLEKISKRKFGIFSILRTSERNLCDFLGDFSFCVRWLTFFDWPIVSCFPTGC